MVAERRASFCKLSHEHLFFYQDKQKLLLMSSITLKSIPWLVNQIWNHQNDFSPEWVYRNLCVLYLCRFLKFNRSQPKHFLEYCAQARRRWCAIVRGRNSVAQGRILQTWLVDEATNVHSCAHPLTLASEFTLVEPKFSWEHRSFPCWGSSIGGVTSRNFPAEGACFSLW